MSNPITPSENIDFERIREIAESVAKYAGRYTGNETFLGYNLKEITPLLPEHAESIPPDGMVKIVFEHWSVVDDRVGFKSKKPYPDPETIDHRVMSYVVSAKDLLEYEEELNGHNEPGDPNGDFDLLDWIDVAVSDGKVPDDVVEALCEYLREQRAGYLDEEFREAFKKGELPKWDPRILKVVEEDCRRSILQDEEYEAMLAAETPEQRKLREGRFWSNMRMVSGRWIGQEVMDTLASIKFYKELRDKTEDPEERKRFQEQVDFLIGSGMVTEEDVARSEKHDREQANES
jgi:hypothetical protein